MPEAKRAATAAPSAPSKAEVEEKMGETAGDLESAMELGYFGTAPDPEPNESYTVKGVTS